MWERYIRGLQSRLVVDKYGGPYLKINKSERTKEMAQVVECLPSK
jgi:hypothetical protein